MLKRNVQLNKKLIIDILQDDNAITAKIVYMSECLRIMPNIQLINHHKFIISSTPTGEIPNMWRENVYQSAAIIMGIKLPNNYDTSDYIHTITKCFRTKIIADKFLEKFQIAIIELNELFEKWPEKPIFPAKKGWKRIM